MVPVSLGRRPPRGALQDRIMADRWKTIEDLFHRARELDVSERSRFLAEACRGDGALRNEVESLLEQASAPGFLESPAFEAAVRALAGGDEPMSEGEQIGSYTILSLIGKGGMGEVYRARGIESSGARSPSRSFRSHSPAIPIGLPASGAKPRSSPL